MNLNVFVKGSCDDFCPPSEIRLRTTEKLLHYFELHPPLEYTGRTKVLPVKCFSRSAAGNKPPQSSDLRTFSSLSSTIDYLLTYILTDDRKPYHYRYDFIFDRLRSVRQEIVMQNFDELKTVQLIEPIVMFLSYSSYELCQSSMDTFDPKICYQHLQECLKKLLCCYDEIEQQHHGMRLQNREFFECLYIVFNLGNVDALNRAIRLRASYVRGELFTTCLTMSLQYSNDNFYNSIRIIKLLPPILCGVGMLSMQKLRREILLRFSSAYHNKMLTVPCKWLADLLLYDNVQLLVADCRYYNVELNLASSDIKFNKLNFDRTKNVNSFSILNDDCINQILELLSVEDLCRCSRTCKRLQTLCDNQFRREYRSEEMLLIIGKDGTLTLRTRYYECVKYFNNFVNRLKINFIHHNCDEQQRKRSRLDLLPVTSFIKTKCRENLSRITIIGNIDLVLLCSKIEKFLRNVEIVQIVLRSRHERNEAEFLKFFPNVTTLHLCRSYYSTNTNAKENVDAILEHKYDQLTNFHFGSCDALSLNDEKLKLFFQANDKIESLAFSFDSHIDVDHPHMDRNDCKTVKFFQTLDYATNLQYFYLSVDAPSTKSFGDIRSYLDILCDRQNFKTLVIAFLFQPGANFLKSHAADLTKWKQLTKIHLYCIPLNDVLPALQSLVHLKEMVLHHPCLRYHAFHLNTNTDAIAEQNIVLPQVEEIQIEESCYDHDVDYHVEQFVGHWMNLKRLLMPGCRKTFAIAELNRARENLVNACELKLLTDGEYNETNLDYRLVKLECVRFEEDCGSAFQMYCKALRK